MRRGAHVSMRATWASKASATPETGRPNLGKNTMEPTLDPRFETAAAMRLVGLRETHAFETAHESVPAQWALFRRRDLPGARGDAAYGVICGADDAAGRFEYMCAVEVADFSPEHDGLGRMNVPPQSYAVFAHEGPIAAIGDLWAAIWTRWLPASGMIDGGGPAFERYNAAFDPAAGGAEIWFPVNPAA